MVEINARPKISLRKAGPWQGNPKVRGYVIQILVAAVALLVFIVAIRNASTHLARSGMSPGFGFLSDRAGFNITPSLIQFNSDSTYARAFLVGLLNTLMVAGLAIVVSTVVGVSVGNGRMARNHLLRGLCTVFVETFRNIPLLLLLLFWYKAVLSVLPSPRESFRFLNGSIFLNNRGIYLPEISITSLTIWAVVALMIGCACAVAYRRWAPGARPMGGIFSKNAAISAALIAMPLLSFIAVVGVPIEINYAQLNGFNFVGGQSIRPEFLSLFLGLAIYNSAFIAEIWRAGINAVPVGQYEAAKAVGLSSGLTMRLAIAPQAMRIVIPPLTSQYLSLIKNSSLAVAIGYPDLVSVFTGTVLNQTGRAIEVISITLAVYLTLSLLTSVLMNWVNANVKVGER